MNRGSVGGDSFEEFETLGGKVGNAVKGLPGALGKTAAGQINPTDPQAAAQKAAKDQAAKAMENRTWLQILYGKSNGKDTNQQKSQVQSAVVTAITGMPAAEPDPQKTQERQQKIDQLRKKLHDEVHFNELEQARKVEEQKDEQEKQQKAQEEQQKKEMKALEEQKEQKDKEELAVVNARKGTGEQLKGVGG